MDKYKNNAKINEGFKKIWEKGRTKRRYNVGSEI